MGAVWTRTDRAEDAVRALQQVPRELPGKTNERLAPVLKAEAENGWTALQAPIHVDERR
jgi:hypothetical protein